MNKRSKQYYNELNKENILHKPKQDKILRYKSKENIEPHQSFGYKYSHSKSVLKANNHYQYKNMIKNKEINELVESSYVY